MIGGQNHGIPRDCSRHADAYARIWHLFLVTKVNFKSYDHTRETVEHSLRLLDTDYLDLLLLHWPFANYYRAWKN